LAISLRNEDLYGQALSLQDLGDAYAKLGKRHQAEAHWEQALSVFSQLDTIEAEQLRARLAA